MNPNNINVNQPVTMGKNVTLATVNGFDLVIFNIENKALHVTMPNIESVKSATFHALAFCTVLKAIQNYHELFIGQKGTSISIREVKKMKNQYINQVLIIIK